MTKTMLNEKNLTRNLWVEAVNTTCYLINRVNITKNTNKTPYELYFGKKPNLGYLKVFGSKCYTLIDREQLEKFDSKSDEWSSQDTQTRARHIESLIIEL